MDEWDGYGNLCVGGFYEHRFAVLIKKTRTKTRTKRKTKTKKKVFLYIYVKFIQLKVHQIDY